MKPVKAPKAPKRVKEPKAPKPAPAPAATAPVPAATVAPGGEPGNAGHGHGSNGSAGRQDSGKHD